MQEQHQQGQARQRDGAADRELQVQVHRFNAYLQPEAEDAKRARSP